MPTSDTATAVLTSKEACTRPRHRRLKKQQHCDRRGFPDAVTSRVLPESAALPNAAFGLVVEVASAVWIFNCAFVHSVVAVLCISFCLVKKEQTDLAYAYGKTSRNQYTYMHT